ncbi:MAG: hypothetical protein IJ157_01315 [Clostridia bacterium]|nr:hypothetical protein [Clostridia bacterium]
MPLFGRRKPGFGQEYLEDAGESAREEAAPTCVGDILAGFIRQNANCGILTGVHALMAQDAEMPRYMREMAQSAANRDIVTIEGSRDVYYYSVNEMSDFFAMITMLSMEKNYPRMMAEMIRYNCRTYPASTPAHYFEQSPYRMTPEEVSENTRIMESLPEYADIRQTRASDGTAYLYSSDYFTEEYAQALADQIEEL